MAAVISGNGLGLGVSTWAELGGSASGSSGIARLRDGIFVNVANGNLVTQGQDESFLGQGLQTSLVRTYNSAAGVGIAGADGWQLSLDRRLEVEGNPPTQVRRILGDGSEQLFTWSGSRQAFVSRDGADADDTLVLANGVWTWTEGTSRRFEQYAQDGGQWRLNAVGDERLGSRFMVQRSGNEISSLLNDANEGLVFSYDGLGRLAQVSTREGGRDVTQAVYRYDGLGRLEYVAHQKDLTQNAGSFSPGSADWAWTRYAYDGMVAGDLKLSKVQQSDGLTLAFDYEPSGRVRQMTVGEGGAARSYRYEYAAGRTDVTDPAGHSWTYFHDAAGRLTAVHEPARDGLRDITQYTWTDRGQVETIQTTRAGVPVSSVRYAYDADGNRTREVDGTGQSLWRQFEAVTNRLLRETRYVGLDANPLDATPPSGALVTRYVYDAQGRVRFQLTPSVGSATTFAKSGTATVVADGIAEVTEFVYDDGGPGRGQLASRRRYTDRVFAFSATGAHPTIDELNSWASTGRATSELSVFRYDALGRLRESVDFAELDAAGSGISGRNERVSRFAYDAQGRLVLETRVASDRSESKRFAYDGLGRLILTVDGVEGDPRSSTVTSTVWNDFDGSVTTTTDAGLSIVETYSKAGELVSRRTSAFDGSAGPRETALRYDTAGRLRMSQDELGGRRYFFYDEEGALIGEVDDVGSVTSYGRDALGRVVSTVRHAVKPNTSTWWDGSNVAFSTFRIGGGSPLAGMYRQITSADDRVESTTYDLAGRISGRRVEGSDSDEALVETFIYDGASRLIEHRRNDRIERYFYDEQGRQVGVLDAEGAYTRLDYDAGGRLILEVRYAVKVAESDRTLPTIPLPSATGALQTRHYYNAAGQRIGTRSPNGQLTEYQYDGTGRLSAERLYRATAPNTSSFAEALTAARETLRKPGFSAAVDVASEVRHTYDARGLKTGETRAMLVETLASGYPSIFPVAVTQTIFQYDGSGRLIGTVRGAGLEEARSVAAWYDGFGQLRGELSAGASEPVRAQARALAVDPASNRDALEALYASHGTRHRYDLSGRRILSIDAEGNHTHYFYDAADRLIFQVRGNVDALGVRNAVGEVTETRYNAFGEIETSVQYLGHIALTMGSAETVRTGLLDTLVALRSLPQFDANGAPRRSEMRMRYSRRGWLMETTSGERRVDTMRWNAFGQSIEQTTDLGGTTERTDRLFYDRRGALTDRIDGVGSGVQRAMYRRLDAFGREFERGDALGTATTTQYDAIGRVVAVSTTVDGRAETRRTTYDAFDRVSSETDAAGFRTVYTYLTETRSVQVTTAEGIRFTRQVNAHGEVLEVSDAAGRTVTTYDNDGAVERVARFDLGGSLVSNDVRTYDALGRLQTADDGTGRITRYRYDALSRVIEIEAPDRAMTRHAYDAGGRNIRSVNAAGEVVAREFDAEGRMTAEIADPDGLALRTEFTWDAQGRQLTLTRGAGTAEAQTTRFDYDVLGRRTADVVDPQGLAIRTQYVYDANDRLIERISSDDRPERPVRQRYVYDDAGRLAMEVDGEGGLTRHVYDLAGRRIQTVRSAARLSEGVAASLVGKSLAEAQPLVAAMGADEVQSFVYDRDGRLVYTLDANNTLEETIFDAAGQAIEVRRYQLPLSNRTAVDAALLAGDAFSDTIFKSDAGNFALRPAQSIDGDQRTRIIRDAAGRERFVLTRARDQAGTRMVWLVAERRFDAAGRVLEDIVHGAPITAATPPSTAAAMEAALLTTSASERRITQYQYDSAGRLERRTMLVDGIQVVESYRYDAIGRRTTVVQPTGTQLVSVYDDAGRLRQSINPDGTETFEYDAAGNQIARIDRLGHRFEAQYDRAGRKIAEFSPEILTAQFDAAGRLLNDQKRQRVVTRFSYDGRGNLLTRTENADPSGQSRTTAYAYDGRGMQVAIVFPGAGTWNPDRTVLSGGGVIGQGPRVETSYDALGRAVANRNAAGDWSYRVYDAAGRLVGEIDELGQVSVHHYDAFGQRTETTRLAESFGFAATPTLAQFEAAIAGKAGRSLAYRYDSAGRLIETLQPEAEYRGADAIDRVGRASTRNFYNARGDLVREAVLLDRAVDGTETWANTVHYYDQMGRRVLSVDGEGQVTAWNYDALGRMTQQVEFARRIRVPVSEAVRPALPAPGDADTGADRILQRRYDAMGRVVQETQRRSFYNLNGSLSTDASDVLTAYDAEGRVIGTSINGVGSTRRLDAVGRVVAMIESARRVVRSDALQTLGASGNSGLDNESLYETVSPLSEFAYDAFGNVVVTYRWTRGTNDGSRRDGGLPGGWGDQASIHWYDGRGRMVKESDSVGHALYHTYDDMDRRVASQHVLSDGVGGSSNVITTFSYDPTGRQTGLNVSSSGRVDLDETVGYNAFGEVIGKSFSGVSGSVRFDYDNAGRVRFTTAEGTAERRYRYNLAGYVVAVEQATLVGADAGQMVETYRTDRLGRAVEINRTAAAGNAITHRVLDRWGNALRVIDARGNATDYRYDDRNQVNIEVKPRVRVVNDDGSESWMRAETHFGYDLDGRLLTTTDANGYTTRRVYDIAGNVIEEVDAAGQVTRFAYDSAGNQRLSDRANGANGRYVSYQDFDNMGRVEVRGEYVMGASGNLQRRELERYVLNQNGDRVQVANALQEVTRYRYDSQGRVLERLSALGIRTAYGYDSQGRKVLERDGNGNERTWTFDARGRLLSRTDLSGTRVDLSVDANSGLLRSESRGGGFGFSVGEGGDAGPGGDPGTGVVAEGDSGTVLLPKSSASGVASRQFLYFPNGLVREIREPNGNYTRYTYDLFGNRTSEETRTIDESPVLGGGARVIHQLTELRYDAQNRLARATTYDLVPRADGADRKVVLDVRYDYDAVGNRRRVITQSGEGPGVVQPQIDNERPYTTAPLPSRRVQRAATGTFRLRVDEHFIDPEGLGWSEDAFTFQLETVARNGSKLLRTLNQDTGWLKARYDRVTSELVFTYNTAATTIPAEMVVRLSAKDNAPTEAQRKFISAEFILKVGPNAAPDPIKSEPDVYALDTRTLREGQEWTTLIDAEALFVDLDEGDAIMRLDYRVKGERPEWLAIARDADRASMLRLTGEPRAGRTTLELTATDRFGNTSVVKELVIEITDGRPVIVARPPIEIAIEQWQLDGAGMLYTSVPVQFLFGGEFDETTLQVSGSNTDQIWGYVSANSELGGSNDGSLWLNLSGYVDRDEDGRGRVTVEVSGTNEFGTTVATTNIIFVGRSNQRPQPFFVEEFSGEISVRRDSPLDVEIPVSALFEDYDAVPEEQRRLLLRSGLVGGGSGYGYGSYGYGYGGYGDGGDGYGDGYPSSPFPVDPALPPGASSGWLTATFTEDGQRVRLRGTPPPTSIGQSTYFSLAFFDGGFALAERGFHIRQRVELPPVREPLIGLADYVVMAGSAFEFTLPPGLFRDLDFDPITLSARLYFVPAEPDPDVPDVPDDGGGPIRPVQGRFGPLPSWMTLDPETGTIRGTAPADKVGHSFRLRLGAQDASGGVGSEADTNYDPLYDFEITVRPPATNTPFQSRFDRTILLSPLNGNFGFSFSAESYVTDPERGAVRFDTVELQRRQGGNFVPYPVHLDGGYFASAIFRPNDNVGTVNGVIRQEGEYRVVANGRDAQGLAVSVVRHIRFENAPPEARPFSATVTAGTPFDLPLSTFVDPDAGWANPPRFSAETLPPGITLTPSGRVQGQIDEVGGVVGLFVTITDSLSGVSRSASVIIRAEAFAGGLSPRVGTEWAFLPGAAQVGDVVGPYRLVQRLYIPGRPATTFSPAEPPRWESTTAPAWITVDPTTGRLEGIPETAGRITLAYEVDEVTPEGTIARVLPSFTLNVRGVTDAGGSNPDVGPDLQGIQAKAGRYFRWVMPATNFVGANDVRIGSVMRQTEDERWEPVEFASWLHWAGDLRRLEGTPPVTGQYRVEFVSGSGDETNQLTLGLEVQSAPSTSTGTVGVPGTLPSGVAFNPLALTLHGGPDLAAWTAMGDGPATTFRAAAARFASQDAPMPPGKVNLETLWFTYDALNRVVINQGALKDGEIGLVEADYWSSRRSHRNVYDAAGRLVAQEALSTRPDYTQPGSPVVTVQETQRFVFDTRGRAVAEGTADSLAGTPLIDLETAIQFHVDQGHDARTAYFMALRERAPEATTLRRYDDLGRLVEERVMFPPGMQWPADSSFVRDPTDPNTVPKSVGPDGAMPQLDVSGWLSQASTFAYDADGRMLEQSSFRRDTATVQRWTGARSGAFDTGILAWVEAAYQEIQRGATAEIEVKFREQNRMAVLSESTVTSFASSPATGARYDWRGRQITASTPALGYDGAGNLLGYTVKEGGRWTDTYAYEYAKLDGYLETRVAGTSSNASRRASETLSRYDGWGRRTSLEERTNLRDFRQTLRSARYFAYDAEGGLISRREGELVEVRNQPLQFRQARKEEGGFKNFNPVPNLITRDEWTAMSASQREYWAGAANTHRYSFANGQLLGSVSEAGQMSVGDRLTGFENSSLGTSTVVVRSGETLRSIAQRIYGDGSLWYVLADANGLTNSDEGLAEGQNLQVPQVGTTRNSASTFKPYDPSEQIGPTAPSLPTIAPAPKNSCNPIAQLLMVIVAVAVSVVSFGAGVTFGAQTLGLGVIGSNIAGGFIAGAAGGLASQAVGSVSGLSSFSWRNVASSAVSGAITAGVSAAIGPVGGQAASVGRLLDAGRPIAAAGLALTNAAAGYIGNKVAGVQGTSFSWRNIAGSAVGSTITARAFNAAGWDQLGAFEVGGSVLQNTVTGFVGGLVSAHTQKAFGADVSINEGRLALDAFGNAVGNALGGKILDARAQQKMKALEARVRRELSAHKSVQPDRVLTHDPSIGPPYDANMDGVHDDSDNVSVNLGLMRMNIDESGVSMDYFGPSMSEIRRAPGLLQAYGRGFLNTTAGALARATQWTLDEYEALSSGELKNSDLAMGMTQFGAFAISELAMAHEDGIGSTRTAKFIAGSGRTAEFFVKNPELLVYGLLDAASEWWESRTPEQRAYGAGQFTGGVAMGVIADRGIGAIGRVPSMLEAMRFNLVDRFPAVAFIERRAVTRLESQAAQRASATSAGTPGVKELVFQNLKDLNRAANMAKPNTRYVLGDSSWTTDALGRLSSHEGSWVVTQGTKRTSRSLQAAIGRSGMPGDVGFHVQAHGLGGPTNRLNVVPGNGRSEVLPDGSKLKNLNQSLYARFEAEIADLSNQLGRPVNVRVDLQYNRGNTTTRPDFFRASYIDADGERAVQIFRNRAGG